MCLSIIIAGAGIGGLTAAIALARNGHDVRVIEQAPEPRPVGAGISLQPNAMQALAMLDLDQAIAHRGCAASIATLRFSNGAIIRSMDFAPYVDRYGYLPITIHRSDLFDVLHDAAIKSGVQVEFGLSLESFELGSHNVTVRTSEREIKCDALIGADGIRSKVRVGLFGEAPVRYSGYVCWRGIVTDPDLVTTIDAMNEMWGPSARCGYMPCSKDKIYWFATKTTADRQRPDGNWKSQFANWPHPVPALHAKTPDSQVVFNEISDRKPIFPWSRGPVTLLGDAAHPMTPNFGQGGAQAIEDAIVLARAVESANDPTKAFQAYEKHRYPRAKWFVDGSLRFGRVAQGGNSFWRLIRNHVIPRIPDSATDKMLRQQFLVLDHLNAALG